MRSGPKPSLEGTVILPIMQKDDLSQNQEDMLPTQKHPRKVNQIDHMLVDSRHFSNVLDLQRVLFTRFQPIFAMHIRALLGHY